MKDHIIKATMDRVLSGDCENARQAWGHLHNDEKLRFDSYADFVFLLDAAIQRHIEAVNEGAEGAA